jgi:hypothetical protein
MNTDLTVIDPLSNSEVTIIVTLAADKRPRDERPVMVSVGVAEQSPVIHTGIFGDLPAIFHRAWTAFGVQAQVASTRAEEEPASEHIVATAEVQNDNPAPLPQPNLATPKPQASNLSLF